MHEYRQRRNERCQCGSGKKYKKCCISKPLESESEETTEDRSAQMARASRAVRRSGLLAGLLGALDGMDVRTQRKLEDRRHEKFLRSEFKRLGKTDEQIDRLVGSR